MHELRAGTRAARPTTAVPAGPVPAAEEERHAEGRERDQVDVLGHRVEAEAHPAVLGVVAGDELLLGLGQVERRPRGLGRAREQEDDEARRTAGSTYQRCRPGRRRSRSATAIPAMITTPRTESASETSYEHELRARPHRAEQRVLRVGRPAAEDEAVDADRADREDQDQRDRSGRRPGRGRSTPPIVQPGPNGITENVVSAVNAARNGARMNAQSIACRRVEALLVEELQRGRRSAAAGRTGRRGSARSAAASAPMTLRSASVRYANVAITRLMTTTASMRLTHHSTDGVTPSPTSTGGWSSPACSSATRATPVDERAVDACPELDRRAVRARR